MRIQWASITGHNLTGWAVIRDNVDLEMSRGSQNKMIYIRNFPLSEYYIHNLAPQKNLHTPDIYVHVHRMWMLYTWVKYDDIET